MDKGSREAGQGPNLGGRPRGWTGVGGGTDQKGREERVYPAGMHPALS